MQHARVPPRGKSGCGSVCGRWIVALNTHARASPPGVVRSTSGAGSRSRTPPPRIAGHHTCRARCASLVALHAPTHYSVRATRVRCMAGAQVGRRGQHVKDKPWMSAKGREGQRAWEDNLERVRKEWLSSGIPHVSLPPSHPLTCASISASTPLSPFSLAHLSFPLCLGVRSPLTLLHGPTSLSPSITLSACISRRSGLTRAHDALPVLTVPPLFRHSGCCLTCLRLHAPPRPRLVAPHMPSR